MLIMSINSINQSVFVIETQRVLCEVDTEISYIYFHCMEL